MARETDDATVAKQASRWVVRLNGSACSHAQHEAFQAWYDAAPAHAAAFDRLQAVWEQMGQVPRRRLRRRAPRSAVLGVVAAILACVAVLAGTSDSRLAPDYAAGWSIRQVDLADGTRVTLDAGAAIDVRMADGQRSVRLLAGRASFDVRVSATAHGIPFKVWAGDVVATARGTQFDVEHDEASTEVAVRDHQVDVRCDPCRPALARVLDPGERLRLSRAAGGSRVSIGALPVADWRQGWLTLDDVPLSDAVAQLARYSPRPIVLASTAARQLHVSGAVATADVAAALRVLVAHSRVGVRSVPGLLVVY